MKTPVVLLPQLEMWDPKRAYYYLKWPSSYELGGCQSSHHNYSQPISVQQLLDDEEYWKSFDAKMQYEWIHNNRDAPVQYPWGVGLLPPRWTVDVSRQSGIRLDHRRYAAAMHLKHIAETEYWNPIYEGDEIADYLRTLAIEAARRYFRLIMDSIEPARLFSDRPYWHHAAMYFWLCGLGCYENELQKLEYAGFPLPSEAGREEHNKLEAEFPEIFNHLLQH